ncbi:bleomycin resistance family protein [Clostridia bacterium]|nr:bleomycin resistance family protein [Clostridia bacterium]
MYASMTTNLMTESVDESVAFYRGVLGFSVTASVPGKDGGLQFAILAKDGLSLMFQERRGLTEEYPILKAQKVRPSATLYIAVDSLGGLYEELKGKCRILRGIHKTFYGADEFAAADNNGYVLTFTQKAGDN